jgi:hypothetical protein
MTSLSERITEAFQGDAEWILREGLMGKWGPVGVPSTNGKRREMTQLHGNENAQHTGRVRA